MLLFDFQVLWQLPKNHCTLSAPRHTWKQTQHQKRITWKYIYNEIRLGVQPHKEPSHELYCNYREGHKAPRNPTKKGPEIPYWKRALLSTPLINKDEKKNNCYCYVWSSPLSTFPLIQPFKYTGMLIKKENDWLSLDIHGSLVFASCGSRDSLKS